jgi:hypothetical protein
MISRTRTGFTTFSLLAALSAGCGSSTTAGTDSGTSDTPTASDTPVTGNDGSTATDSGSGSCTNSYPSGTTTTTYDYVINTLTIDSGGTSFTVPYHGFNVDNAFTPAHPRMAPPDCSHQDYFSAIDPDQNMGTCSSTGTGCVGGVDNQLPSLATTISATGTDVGMALGDELTQGKLILLVRVSGVHGTPSPTLTDCNVNVTIFVGHPLGTSCSTIFNGSSMFAVDNSSLNTAGDLTSAKYQFTGQIINGRLSINPGTGAGNTFAIPLPPIAGVNITLNVHNLQVRLSMTATAGSNGNLGGFLLTSDVTSAIETALPQYATLVGGVIGGLSDVATGSPAGCYNVDAGTGGIGLGFGFTTVGAVISPTAVTGAPSGTCGGSGSTDGGSTPTTDASVPID